MPAVDEVCPVRFARIADSEFEYWQNSADQLLYRSHPERLQGLPLVSGEWSEEHPGLWQVHWHPTPIVETSDRDLFRRMELFRESAFGDPMERARVATVPPRGSVAHELTVVTSDAEARRSLKDWAARTDGITTRQASRITNPKTGEVIQGGDDLVRWHDHSDGWRREFLVGPRGLVAVRPDVETANFLRNLASNLGLAIEETDQ